MNYSKLIDDLGGTSKVAELFEVTTGAVSQWREDGIPRARLLHLKAIRPDLFKNTQEEKAA
jgi:hypothetical protein